MTFGDEFMKRSSSTSVFTCALSAVLAAGSAGAALGQNVSPTINDSPSRQFGQSPNSGPLSQQLSTGAANLVEGRELNGAFSLAFDMSATPHILYVADTFNHRILAFKNPDSMKPCGINTSNTPSTCGAADKVIGQRDFYGTQQGGPGRTGLNNGFAFPNSIAVDSNGNLYVMDSGNNRILRFPAPFKQTGSLPTTDLVIGQKTINTPGLANQGNPAIADATTLYLGGGAGNLAINPTDGSLWVADYNNYRVLRFPASVLTPGNVLPQADMVLGQLTMNANTFPATCTQSQLAKNCVFLPSSLTFDSGGNLYVGDAFQRVLYFLTPNANGISANRVLGLCEAIAPVTSANCSTTNQFAFGVPGGLFNDGTNLYVADVVDHRIVKFDTPNNWPAGPASGESPQTHQDSPPFLTLFGQSSMQGGKVNKGQPEPDATTFQSPRGGAFNGTDMWVADAGNNRVLGFSLVSNSYSQANRVIGQVDFFYMQPNLIEGRELWLSATSNGGTIIGGAVAIDHNSTPPHLYVADTLNNRILGFNDARKVQAGQKADIVIGQQDLPSQPGSRFYRALSNNPVNDATLPQQTGLNIPTDVLVDPKDGSLWVADTGNGRVLRFPPPSFTSTTPLIPNLVLGQQDFTSVNPDPTNQSMANPRGLAFLQSGNVLAVSDAVLNRVLIFKRASGQDFTKNQVANSVLGQSGFNSRTPGNGQSGLNQPSHIAVDSSDRLYIADTANGRLVIYNNTVNLANGANSALQLAVSQPVGVIVSQATGESWVTVGSGLLWRLPEFGTLQLQSNPNAPPYTQQIFLQDLPFAITLDNSNNLIVAEQANRITFYYPKLSYYNAASYNGGDSTGRYNQGMAPGQLMLLYQVGQNFNFQTNTENSNPWPTVMSDLQVTINGTAAPIFRVDTIDIALQIPTNAPTSGTADFLVTHPSTGEVVAAGSIPMAQYNPGFFTSSSNGIGQVAAINGDDGSVNTPANPITAKGGTHYLSLYLTGGGVFDGGPGKPPADGFAPSDAQGASTHDRPQILGNDFGGFLPDSALQYSGAGAFAGGYQINFFVPANLAPGPHQIVVLLGGVASNVGPNGAKILTTFYTK
jgi:uncharacterized protein (TIGR03437 family)